MLESLDVLIGLTVVMLIISMVVTLLNQAILNLLASRAGNLRDGLTDLLELLDAGMTREEGKVIAENALLHPVIGGKIGSWIPARIPFVRAVVQFYKRGNVIHREEFVKLLLGFGASWQGMNDALKKLEAEVAAGNKANIQKALDQLKADLQKIPQLTAESFENLITELNSAADAVARKKAFESLKKAVSEKTAPFEKLLEALHQNGIQNPADTLKNVRQLALQFEKSHPELAGDFRQANALLQAAFSEFLAKINQNFDQVMDRVSVRYTATTRVVTLISAAAVAVALQLDTIHLINRFSIDDALRESFVETAVRMSKDQAIADAQTKSNDAAQAQKEAEAAETAARVAKSSNAADAADKEKAAQETRSRADALTAAAKEANSADVERKKEYLAFLAKEGLINLPNNPQTWWRNWADVSIPGVVISTLLLSLGAPFWYNTLGEFLRLRSLLAQKDDAEKNARQLPGASATVSPRSPSPDNSTSPNPLQGERGDPNAVG